jgi:hypothetical protein
MLCAVRVNPLKLVDASSRGVLPSKNVSVIVIMCTSNPLNLQSVCESVQTKKMLIYLFVNLFSFFPILMSSTY